MYIMFCNNKFFVFILFSNLILFDSCQFHERWKVLFYIVWFKSNFTSGNKQKHIQEEKEFHEIKKFLFAKDAVKQCYTNNIPEIKNRKVLQ